MLSVVEYRRALHRIPELDDRLPETCAYVQSALASFELETFSPIPSSVCAFREGRNRGLSGGHGRPAR